MIGIGIGRVGRGMEGEGWGWGCGAQDGNGGSMDGDREGRKRALGTIRPSNATRASTGHLNLNFPDHSSNAQSDLSLQLTGLTSASFAPSWDSSSVSAPMTHTRRSYPPTWPKIPYRCGYISSTTTNRDPGRDCRCARWWRFCRRSRGTV